MRKSSPGDTLGAILQTNCIPSEDVNFKYTEENTLEALERRKSDIMNYPQWKSKKRNSDLIIADKKDLLAFANTKSYREIPKIIEAGVNSPKNDNKKRYSFERKVNINKNNQDVKKPITSDNNITKK